MVNKIVLEANAKLQDVDLRKWFDEWSRSIQKKIDNINERTKNHTLQIKDLEKLIKKDVK